MRDFNFGNAFFHFTRTDAPRGFTWKYILSFGAALLGFLILYGLVFGGLFFSLFGAEGDPAAIERTIEDNAGWLIGGYLIILPLMWLFMAVFEASFQRRYMRADTFKLRLGGDELRLFVVYLIWFAFYIVFYIAVVALAAGTGSGLSGVDVGAAGIGAVLMGFVALAAWTYFAVRLAPAAALTIRDRAIRFPSAWRVTRGRFWPLLGCYLVYIVALFVAYILVGVIVGLTFAGVLGAFGGLADPNDADALAEVFSSPLVLIVGGVFYFGLLAAYAWFIYVWAGPAALAARTDPDHAGMNNPAEAFN